MGAAGMAPPSNAAAASGWYGKVPSAGDFVARRVTGAFCDAWGRWLQQVLEGSRARLGAPWLEHFLSMPAWRFVLAGGLVTPGAWAGVMVPSVDAVGRYFPLAVTSALPAERVDVVATLLAARSWFDEMEQIAVSAIAPRADMGALDAAVAARPFCAQWLRGGAEDELHGGTAQCFQPAEWRGEAPRAAWLAEPSDIFGRTLLVGDALPRAEAFCAMMNGQWRTHGWLPRAAG
jgi:type VI secretion system protein ImpM